MLETDMRVALVITTPSRSFSESIRRNGYVEVHRGLGVIEVRRFLRKHAYA